MANCVETTRLILASAAMVACLLLVGCTPPAPKQDKFNACIDMSTLQFSAISMGSSAPPVCGPSEVAVSWSAAVPGNGGPLAPTKSSQGALGNTGATGARGPAGARGDTGASGAAGAPGRAGAQGDTGVPGPTGPAGAKGDTGAAGASGLPGKDGNSILNGSGQPSATLGNDGDFYLDITDFVLYGPRTSGAWPEGTQRLIGPEGPIGPQGPQGETGATGAPGSVGSPGPQGPQGLPGPAGPAGATGPAGKDGAPGPQGPAGPAGGTASAPNPNNLTYRMSIGTDPATQITGFTQKISNPGSVMLGGGKPNFGDVVATLPMNSSVLTQLTDLATGTHIPTASVEMCKPGEVTGNCTLELSLTDVLVVSIDIKQDPTQATATVQLNFAREKASIFPGAPRPAVTYEWDIAGNTLISSSGSTDTTTRSDSTTYTVTLPGSPSVIPTRSWHMSATQSGTTHMGGGGGAGKANFADISVETRTGPATIAMISDLTTGKLLTSVVISGCEASVCASKTVLSSVLVTDLVLGSPSLFDAVQFSYGTIKWDRNDTGVDPSKGRSFFWNVLENVGR